MAKIKISRSAIQQLAVYFMDFFNALSFLRSSVSRASIVFSFVAAVNDDLNSRGFHGC